MMSILEAYMDPLVLLDLNRAIKNPYAIDEDTATLLKKYDMSPESLKCTIEEFLTSSILAIQSFRWDEQDTRSSVIVHSSSGLGDYIDKALSYMKQSESTLKYDKLIAQAKLYSPLMGARI